MRPRARNQNGCKIGFTQWNLMKQRLLLIGKALAPYSKKNSFAVFNEFLVPHHVKRFDVGHRFIWMEIARFVKKSRIYLFLNKYLLRKTYLTRDTFSSETTKRRNLKLCMMMQTSLKDLNFQENSQNSQYFSSYE